MVDVRDLGIGRLKRELGAMADHEVLAGVIGDRARAMHPNADVSVGQVAAWLEYGTSNQPARPFLQRMLQEQGPALRKRARRMVADMIDGRAKDALGALDLLATAAEKATVESFDSMNAWAEPLAESTVARKGHDTIGVDTGTVRRAISARAQPKVVF